MWCGRGGITRVIDNRYTADSGGEPSVGVCREREREREERERNGVERYDDRSPAGIGNPDVLQRPPKAPLHAP